MAKCRKALALLLTVLMVFSLLPMTIAAEDPAESTQPVWPAEGSIKLDKDASAVKGVDNLWEVTLSIQGKNYKTTSDVVLVIDCSGSMGEGTKLENTRTAAKAFGDKLLTNDSSTRIAIVTYIDEATAYNNGHFYGADELEAFKTAVDAATDANGGTNQQAGIHKAQELLKSTESTGKLKNIVILSDGEATYSYPFVGGEATIDCRQFIRHRFSGNPKVTNWPTTATPDYTTIIGSGNSFELDGNIIWNCTCEHNRTTQKLYGSFYYNSNGNLVCSNGEKSSDNGVATIWEANQAKAAGTTIFSVALQAGTNGENTLKACATDAATGYYAIGQNDNVEQKLTDAFEAIAGSIAIAARNGAVVDPMGDKVQLSFSGSAPVITTDKAVYDAGQADVYISQGSVTYDDAYTGTINWTVGDINEGKDAVMKYHVSIKADADVQKGELIPTNGVTTFSYTNYLEKQTTKEFDVPNITLNGGLITMHYYLVNSEGTPINQYGETVESPGFAYEVKEQEYFKYNGSEALDYATYEVTTPGNIGDYSYAGYVLNNDTFTKGNSASVTLTAANSNQHVWFAYTQGFQVVHVTDGTAGTPIPYSIGDKVEGIYVDGKFNLTACVTNGYLYGGTFESDYTTVHPEFTGANAKNPTSFHPTAGATYYIWEVNKDYLRPRSVSGARTTSAGTDVVGFFIMTPIDREYYSEVGFTVNDIDVLKANQVAEWYVTNGGETTTHLSNLDRTVVYNEFQIQKTNNQYDTYTVGSFSTNSNISAGYLACVSLDKTAYWNNAGNEITFVPYWITMDGVKVTNMTRTCKYLGAGANDAAHRMIGMIAEKENDATSITYVNTIQTQNVEPLMVMAAYCGGNTVDSNPEQPIEPVQPTEPEVPEKDTVTVTVVDYDTKYVLELQSGDVTEYIKYTGEKNCLFAGWYTDEAYTNPADFTYVTEDITIFAKYVSDSYLRLSYDEKRSYSNWKRTLTLSTTAPEDDFREIGFLVNGEMCIAKDKKSFGYGERFNDQYDSSYNFVYAFGFGFGYPAFGEKPVDLERTLTYALSVTRGETYEITPYWVTMDGTTVYGESRTLNVQRYGVNG